MTRSTRLLLPTVVLLPGLQGSKQLFRWFEEALPAHVNCQSIAYPPEGPYAYEALCSWLEHRLRGLTSFVLVAESFGGPLALRYAAKHPKGLCGLVLVASFAEPPLPKRLRAIPDCLLRLLPMHSKIPRYLLAGSSRGEELDEALREAISQVSTPAFVHRVRAILSTTASAHLTSLSMPLLYLRLHRSISIWAEACFVRT